MNRNRLLFSLVMSGVPVYRVSCFCAKEHQNGWACGKGDTCCKFMNFGRWWSPADLLGLSRKHFVKLSNLAHIQYSTSSCVWVMGLQFAVFQDLLSCWGFRSGYRQQFCAALSPSPLTLQCLGSVRQQLWSESYPHIVGWSRWSSPAWWTAPSVLCSLSRAPPPSWLDPSRHSSSPSLTVHFWNSSKAKHGDQWTLLRIRTESSQT